MPKNIIKLSIAVLILVSLYSCGKSLKEKQADIGTAIFYKHDFEKARSLALEYFKKDKSDCTAYLLMISDEEGKYYAQNFLQVQDGWKWYIDDDYVYIKGRIKNTGDKVVDYFEVHSDFLNNSNAVVDTAYTNSAEDLLPGNMKSFEIMHQYSSDIKYVSLTATKASLR